MDSMGNGTGNSFMVFFLIWSFPIHQVLPPKKPTLPTQKESHGSTPWDDCIFTNSYHSYRRLHHSCRQILPPKLVHPPTRKLHWVTKFLNIEYLQYRYPKCFTIKPCSTESTALKLGEFQPGAPTKSLQNSYEIFVKWFFPMEMDHFL